MTEKIAGMTPEIERTKAFFDQVWGGELERQVRDAELHRVNEEHLRSEMAWMYREVRKHSSATARMLYKKIKATGH